MAHDRHDDRQSGAYQTEHWLAWLLALTALGLGAIGLLVGFGMLGTDDVPQQAVPDAATTNAATANWEQGLLWLLPAIAAGLLAMGLHGNEHHARRAPRDDKEKGLFGIEHALAYVLTIATIAAGTLTLLVGFDVFDNGNVPADGYLWATAAILGGVVTSAVHNVRHHQLATDEDYIALIVEERVSRMPVTGTTTTTGAVRERRIEHQ
jgi:hypothetical protein